MSVGIELIDTQHKKEHQDFINKVNGLYGEIEKDKSVKNNYGIEMMTELFHFLREWMLHHIMITDRQLLANSMKII